MARVGGGDFDAFDLVGDAVDGQVGAGDQCERGAAGNGAFDIDGLFFAVHVDLDNVAFLIHGFGGLCVGAEFDGRDDKTGDCAFESGSAEIDGVWHD